MKWLFDVTVSSQTQPGSLPLDGMSTFLSAFYPVLLCVPCVKGLAFDSQFPSRYRCPHERSQSHAPVRSLARTAHPYRSERPPPETHEHEERCLHVPPRHLLPLGATLAGSLPRARPCPKSFSRRRSSRRKFWHLARHRRPPDLGCQRFRRSLAHVLRHRLSPSGRKRTPRGRSRTSPRQARRHLRRHNRRLSRSHAAKRLPLRSRRKSSMAAPYRHRRTPRPGALLGKIDALP